MERDTAFQENFDKLIFDFGLTRKILAVFIVLVLFLKFIIRLNIPWLVPITLIFWFVLYLFVWPKLIKKAKDANQLENLYFSFNVVDLFFV